MSIRVGLTNLGVAGPLAAEFQAQIAAGTGNVRRLMELGFVAAHQFVAGLNAGSVKVTALAEVGVPTEVAKYLAAQVNTAPVNTVPPAITGTAQVGQTLTVSNGTWTSKSAITYARQWRAAGVNIGGATGTTYVPVAGDVGKAITCVVTANNANGGTSVVTAATAAVIAA